jgi:glycosyltransferase involved in cell wall biosynthesis
VRSLHVPFGYFPDPVGGTEVYVSAMAQELQRRGHPAIIAAPGLHGARYHFDGLPVRRFAVSSGNVDLFAIYGNGDAGAAHRFASILDEERPDILHLHALSPAVSSRLLDLAEDRHVPVVFTYHTPTASCVRGTLMYRGRSTCDGRMETVRCTACWTEGRGVPPAAARLLARIPPLPIERAVGPSPIWTSAFATTLVAKRNEAARRLFAASERIFAPRKWVEELLVANGVPAQKIVRGPQPLCMPVTVRSEVTRAPGPLRVAFLGRLDPTKGAEILVRAIRSIPDVPIELDIFGISDAAAAEREAGRLRQIIGDDYRISLKDAVPPGDVGAILARHDVLGVPSQWMETGPLVVLEAYAAGIPVVGSALGGLLELVQHNTNGLLVQEYASPSAWADALITLTDTTRLETLRRGITPPETLSHAADLVVRTYESVLGSRS